MSDADRAALVEARLAAARTKLILDKPFLGALVLRLPLIEGGEWCQTTATDARAIYYNPHWIANLTASQLQFALAHEALHCALGHFARRGHRHKARWDLACDLAINPLLVAEGLTPPVEAIVLAPFSGMSAEEIYPCLEDNPDNETMDDHAWDGDDGGGGGGSQDAQGEGGGQKEPDEKVGAGETAQKVPSALSPAEREKLQQQWQRQLAAAAQRARESGKLSGVLARLTESTLAVQVSWRALLAQYLAQIAHDDYSWQRPSRRSDSGSGDMILPSLRSTSGNLAVAIDVSGSIVDDDLANFLGELNALKGTVSTRITLFACDADLVSGSPWECETWEELRLPVDLVGGGGTSFVPVFDWLQREGLRPDALLWFTDADGEFPEQVPDYPVIWLVKGARPVPFGQRVALN
jgi:predicted metal-dependent peptidase